VTRRQSLALLIPAYNAAGFLPRLLESAQQQTEPFDEIWVYDDCSTDDTGLVAERYGARVVRGDINRGCSAGKNELARRAKADWLHFHDADDELLPCFVSSARRWMNNSKVDVVLFGYEEYDAGTGRLTGVRLFDAVELRDDPRSYAIREQINPFCGLYRREAFLRAGGYDDDPLVLFNEDVAFHIRMAFAGLAFDADANVCIINHRRIDSMSAANGLKCAQAHYHVMRRALLLEGADDYKGLVAMKLWRVAAALGSYLDWDTADKAVMLADRLGGPSAAPSGAVFKVLCGLSPRLALRIRELLIRMLKPQLRAGYPKLTRALGKA
jgi:glycosyltransferase involved in cell wall biosynthesis